VPNIRDPQRVAWQWLERHRALLAESNQVTVLGCGSGEHIHALVQEFPHLKIQVLELEKEKVRRTFFPKVTFLNESTLDSLSLVLEFRPAWGTNGEKYEEISRQLRGLRKKDLQKSAEDHGLLCLSQILLASENEIAPNIKDIAALYPLENQTAEAKIWRTLRELVQ